MIGKCIVCHKEFRYFPSNRSGKYCSAACLYKKNSGSGNCNYGKDFTGSNNPRWKGGLIKKTCVQCGNEYRVIRCLSDKSKFCSRKCRSSYYKKMNEVVKECLLCGNKFTIKRWVNKNFCSKECRYKSASGEKSHFYKNGLYPLKESVRKCRKYKNWQQSILSRNRYTCSMCGKVGGTIHVDHIIPFSFLMEKNRISSLNEAYQCRELWDELNTRVLCLECHKKTDTYGWKSYHYNQYLKEHYGTKSY